MFIVVFVMIIVVAAIVGYYIYLTKNRNSEEYNQLKELKRRIEELDNDVK